MSIAGSVFLVAVGAILRYALNIQWDVINLETVGLILMVAGIVGLALSFAYQAFANKQRSRPAGSYDDGYSDRAREEQPTRRMR